MKTKVELPNWVPEVETGSKILIVGASGGIGCAVVQLLLKGTPCVIGAHRSSSAAIFANQYNHNIIDLQCHLKNDTDCRSLVDVFVEKAQGIDALIVLCGGMSGISHWKNVSEQAWQEDINLNLNIPFLLSRAAMPYMRGNGGRIVLTGTESSLHGGSPIAFAYGVAKRGIECLVQGLAKEGAKYNILVNGVRPGFIRTGAHERWQKKTEADLLKREQLIPLKRAGQPEEVAALMIYLLSGWAQFITGQMFSITGGDWL